MRNIIIGDVHGCIDELKLLIKKCKLNEDDQIYFLGDLINKGPNSLDVLNYVLFISEFYNVKLIIGNHELKFLRFINYKINNPKALNQMKLRFDLYDLERNISSSALDLLKLGYFSYRIPEIEVLLIHGGITKNCKLDFNINNQYDSTSFKKSKELELLTMTRYLNNRGDFVPMGNENEDSKFWAEEYDGRFGLIIFGHQVFFESKPIFFKNAIGLDGGCVFGGYLFALIFEDNSKTFIKVKSLKKYL